MEDRSTFVGIEADCRRWRRFVSGTLGGGGWKQKKQCLRLVGAARTVEGVLEGGGYKYEDDG